MYVKTLSIRGSSPLEEKAASLTSEVRSQETSEVFPAAGEFKKRRAKFA